MGDDDPEIKKDLKIIVVQLVNDILDNAGCEPEISNLGQ